MFSDKPEIQALKNKLHEISDISSAGAVLSWDQEVNMPPKGSAARGQQLATLAAIGHSKMIDPEIGELITDADRVAESEYDKALVREMKRAYERATKIPPQLVKDMTVTTSRAFGTWRTAKAVSDFAKFAPDLAEVLRLRLEIAKKIRVPGQSLYDTLLDEFEPGLTEAEVERVFAQVRKPLSTLAKQLAEKTKGADEILKGKTYEEKQQWEMGMQILRDMGYDLEAGRQDVSPHPFTITFGVQDVRITTWKNETDPRPALFATIHEAGHALYEQGVDVALDRLFMGETGGLSGGTGLAMHESQSRLWENIVGRSPEFWAMRDLPWDVDKAAWIKAINVVKPSLVRVEADEVSYGLHIMVRFEIEKELVNGKLEVADLPKAWNAKYQELLGVTPSTDSEGVLQDIHWAHGAFGYFPTYLLGSMIAAQLWRTYSAKYSGLSTQEDLKRLREWLRENIHKHGRVYSTKELLVKVTGEELNPEYYLEYLENKFKKLYN